MKCLLALLLVAENKILGGRMKELLVIFFVLLFGCGGGAGAKPCIPTSVVHVKSLANQITISERNLSEVLKRSKIFFNKNFRYASLCVLSETDSWYAPEAYDNSSYALSRNVFLYWYNFISFKFGIVSALIHPTQGENNIGGLGVARSFLDAETHPLTISWCTNDIIKCQIVFIHELLHTIGAGHTKEYGIMYRYIVGESQLVVLPETRTGVRRYLKRKGLL